MKGMLNVDEAENADENGDLSESTANQDFDEDGLHDVVSTENEAPKGKYES